MRLGPRHFVRKGIRTVWREAVLPVLRERTFQKDMFDKQSTRQSFEVAKYFFQLSRITFFRDRLPEFNPEKNSISWIPINRDIEGAEGMALPEEILDRLIEKAQHRVLLNVCGCRKSLGCKDYPADIGCLMMGESALKIPDPVRREVGVEEAKAHVRKAIKAGLIPITGKARIDNDIFMIPDEGKLLTVCLCCECCCVTRYSRYVPVDVMEGIQPRVEGLSVTISDNCIGCGTCAAKCYIKAIEMRGRRPVIGAICRVCGRCATHCPQQAIKLKLNNPKAVDDVVQRIEAAVDF